MSSFSTPFSTRATRDLMRPSVALSGVASLLLGAKLGVGEADTTAGSLNFSRLCWTRPKQILLLGVCNPYHSYRNVDLWVFVL